MYAVEVGGTAETQPQLPQLAMMKCRSSYIPSFPKKVPLKKYRMIASSPPFLPLHESPVVLCHLHGRRSPCTFQSNVWTTDSWLATQATTREAFRLVRSQLPSMPALHPSNGRQPMANRYRIENQLQCIFLVILPGHHFGVFG